MTTATQVEYLTEIKLRNAVRKVIGFGLQPKSDIITRRMTIGKGFKADFSRASFRNEDNDAVWFVVNFGTLTNPEFYTNRLIEAGFEFATAPVLTWGYEKHEQLLIRKAI